MPPRHAARRRPPPRATIRSPARKDSSSRTTRAAGHSASKSANAFVDAPRKRWIDWSSSPAAVISPRVGHEQPQQQALGEARVLQVVDEHVPVAAGEPRAHVRLLAQQPERAQHEVAEVERPRVAQHPVVRAEQLPELALARGARALGLAER